MSQPQRFSQLFNWMPHSLRPRRLRADYLLRRSILYVLLTILVVAGYALLVGGLSLIFGGAIGANNPWLIGLMVALLALILLPLRNGLQKGVDALLLRGQRAYQQHIQDFSHELSSAIELTSILRTLRQHILEAWLPTNCTSTFTIRSTTATRPRRARMTARPATFTLLPTTPWSRRLAGRARRSRLTEPPCPPRSNPKRRGWHCSARSCSSHWVVRRA